MLISSLLCKREGIHFFILNTKEDAAYFNNDLLTIISDDQIVFFPSSYKRSVKYLQQDYGNIILRANVLNRLDDFSSGLLVIVTYTEAIAERVINKNRLSKDTLHLKTGEKFSISFIREVLESCNFELVDFVYEPGQYSVRGSIIDIFSFSSEFPYRIDFFGDEIDSLRSFEPESQLSRQKFDKISILPNIQEYTHKELHRSLFEFCAKTSAIWIEDTIATTNMLEEIESVIKNDPKFQEKNKVCLYDKKDFIEDLNHHSTIEFGVSSYFSDSKTFEFSTKNQPLFQKNFNVLAENLKMYIAQDFEVYLLSENEKQIERLMAIFKDILPGITFRWILQTLHEGFIDNNLKICCYTDHQIFDRYHKYRLHQYFSNKASVSLNELKDLKPGDYIVHIDHGIGRFGGLEKIEVNGKMQEGIKLFYRDNDILFVNIHALHKISKYKGKDGTVPKIYKLGTGAWQKLKDNTKKKVKDIAKDLIALYAKRKSQTGFQFSPDTYLQEELEASFLYEDTPDQLNATLAVKSDMESDTPMDRLVCGDVGFGKTEIAIRASFKAVTDSKQVVILVPTTILALQHYTTFNERLNNFPCTIEFISRLKKNTEQKRILSETESGKIDILIGTHRLLSKDIKFKDLGLLIIDEEQKFGVTAKEKLKRMKLDVDTLTMTATPIPRTMQFSLMGARDLSVINTPPPNRHPIITELHTFNESIIKEGIEFEVSRGGQVFFIHNHIQNILEVEALIKKLCPFVKTAVGHGQMEGQKLEEVMLSFVSGNCDVLVSTTIVESGLDIPNANTIFINNAQNFGLSDLHQLRGRVGRSNKKAFCYLIAPPLTSVTPEARRRLKAIEEYSDLGSGFNIALQDLDIRGAGNLLGAEQSGFIADIGFDTYNRILNEALRELKENEFKDLYKKIDESSVLRQKGTEYFTDCAIDTDLEIHLPDEYVSNISERIRLYRQLDSIINEKELVKFEDDLVDRFGPLPHPTKDLLQIVRLRWVCEKLGFEKVIIKNNKLIAHFISERDSYYFHSDTFTKILNFVQKKPAHFRMKEMKNKLTITIDEISGLNKAILFLTEIFNGDK
ncbi:MAG: transcription-repair coupling factor [Bacteroidales bacterium]|nr:transcription-repair coupling factor [Bacteroidales bacterium]